MSQPEVYQEVQDWLAHYLRDNQGQPTVGKRALDRVTLLVTSMLKAQHSAPAKLAQAGHQLGERAPSAESVERRVRRIENDPWITADTSFTPLVKTLLADSAIQDLILIVDPTLQEDRVVKVSINVGYRGRSLPLVWTIWPANQPLEGEGFWQRIDELLRQAQALLPPGVVVTVLADRAFGTPAFTDLVAQRGWHWLVRVQGQTHYQDLDGHEQPIAQLVTQRGQRRKLRGVVFKKAGWRDASVVVYWGYSHKSPLCLVSDRAPAWSLIGLYRRRFAIEPTFRDDKSFGWQWEAGQVTDLDHLQHLLVGMALATWLTLIVGAKQAVSILTQASHSRRRTRAWWGKQSLFHLGLQLWQECFSEGIPPWLWAGLPDWQAPNWSTQLSDHYARAFLFG
ncbi:MAG TPA: transposase [Anaerolineaceae bacterium]